MSVEVRDRMILIDGKPRQILSGEIHYFRLARAEWQDRIDRLIVAGGNCVASYVPWIVHEQPDGTVDLDGRIREEHDLLGFIDLCHRNGLWFVLRPGPFIMAEMKNEGLPYRLYQQHPEIVPVTWDGRAAPTRTVDYLAPAFLDEVRGWFRALLPHIVPRLQHNGGPIIAVQLDNEVGMLSWVSQAPDLTDLVLADFARWLRATVPGDDLATRYPFDLTEPSVRATAIRSPDDRWAAPLARDLGRYMRERYARYFVELRTMCEAEGIAGVPLLINVHGTGGGRGLEFPIGISQLLETHTREPGWISGSDHYLGDLTRSNFVDLHLINALMVATNRPEAPLTALEFEAGDGDYSGDGSTKNDPSAADFKLRMSVMQGNRLINYYLFSGGINYRLDPPSGDGNDRISFTGERHGNAAPIGPEGETSPTYPRLASAGRAVMAVGDHLATMREEHDGIAFGFNPDDFLTENTYPGSAATREMDDDLARFRFGGPSQGLARSLLLLGFRYGAVDIRHPIDPEQVPCLCLGSARSMDEPVQRNLVDYLNRGGTLVLNGAVPFRDLAGRPATTLLDALGLRPTSDRTSESFYYLSIEGSAWAADLPEYRVGLMQGFDAGLDGCFLRAYGTGEGCGFERPVGAGHAIVITTELPGNTRLLQELLGRRGVRPALGHGAPEGGIYMSSARAEDGSRLILLLNLDGFQKTVRLVENGDVRLLAPDLILQPREAVLIPIDLKLPAASVRYATTEILAHDGDSITFRRMLDTDIVELKTERTVLPDPSYDVTPTEVGWQVRSRHSRLLRAGHDDTWTIRLAA
ncbi:MAG TPA: beta-galactosidase [Thermomicrobiales bacterium]|jgi:beta-galactosidase|nr:beta-galactosidase [Thermomicrobiales bacterium]